MPEYFNLLSNHELIINVILSALAAVLLIWQVLSLRKIRALKKTLVEEEEKRTFPLLTLKLVDEKHGLFLINDSYCYARDIIIKDMPIVLNLDFKKSLLLKFEPLDLLKPGQKEKLKFRVFDGKFEDLSKRSEHLLYYFPNAEFEMQVDYSNIENTTFREVISVKNKKFYIKEAKSLLSTDTSP